MKSPHSKRRSSMRRSLLDTLGSMPSTSTNQNESLSIAPASLTTSEEPKAKKMKVESAGDSIELPESCRDEKVEKFIIQELQRELDGWTKLLHKFRDDKDDTTDFLEIIKSCCVIPTKYQLQNQQIIELEVEFSSSLGIISAFLERVQTLNANHAQNIQNITQRLYENRLKKFLSTDPKVLIRQILEIHGQHNSKG